MSEPIVRPKHLRQARICMQGARPWWKERGWNWDDFLVNGVSATVMEATGDPLALRVAALARAEHGR